jgi:hypothetical protein
LDLEEKVRQLQEEIKRLNGNWHSILIVIYTILMNNNFCIS